MIAEGISIRVNGECNIGGEIERTLVVGQATEATTTPVTEVPGFTALIVTLALAAVMLYRHVR